MNKVETSSEKTYLAIPKEEKEEAKKAAGKLPSGQYALEYDRKLRLWFARPGADLEKVAKWLPDNEKARSNTKTDPVMEFKSTLEAAGFVLDGLPEMDGERHRVPTEADLQQGKGKQSGAYTGYLDGHPAGWYQDFRVHENPVKWKATGQQMDYAVQAHLKAVSAQRMMEKKAKQAKSYDHHAKRSAQLYELLPDAKESQAYLERKGVRPSFGVKMDKRNRLVIPLENEDGEIRSLQRISGNGFKSLKKGAQKAGNYFVVGGELKNGEPILYAEGYATSASINEATSRPVVMTVDAGNLAKVAEKLSAKFPSSAHIFLGDDDRKNEVNKGREKAEAAAKLTNGAYAVPEFDDQDKKSGLSDFNDLHQSKGLSAVKAQVEIAISKVHKVENMSDQPDKKPGKTPVITEKFEQELDSVLSKTETARRPTPAVEPTRPASNHAPAEEEYFPSAKDDEFQSDAIEEYFSSPQSRTSIDGGQDRADTVTETVSRTSQVKAEPPQEVAKESELGAGKVKHTEAENGADEVNSVEPYIENKKALTADTEARAWLASRRIPAEDLLPKEQAKTAEDKTQAEGKIESADSDAREWLAARKAASEEIVPPEQKSRQVSETFEDDAKFKLIVPERVTKSYIEVDGKYYFNNRPDSLAFVDKGSKLQTKLNNSHVASSMVDIAEARGWNDIQLNGTKEFKREAWLEATSRGLTAHGYKPREEDLARLKKLASERQTNEIGSEHQNVKSSVTTPSSSSPASDRKAEASQSSGESVKADAVNTPAAETPEKSPEYNLAGKIVAHGKAPYENNPDNRESYYVTLENEAGKKSTTWGVDLERAIEESGTQKGDKVELKNLGRQPVTVERPKKDDKGAVIGKETINTHRNTWEVKADAIRDKKVDLKQVLNDHPDLINEVTMLSVAGKFGNKNFTNDKDRESFMEQVREKIANNVAKGEPTKSINIRQADNTAKVTEIENER